jgi:hypothetical protein
MLEMRQLQSGHNNDYIRGKREFAVRWDTVPFRPQQRLNLNARYVPAIFDSQLKKVIEAGFSLPYNPCLATEWAYIDLERNIQVGRNRMYASWQFQNL